MRTKPNLNQRYPDLQFSKSKILFSLWGASHGSYSYNFYLKFHLYFIFTLNGLTRKGNRLQETMLLPPLPSSLVFLNFSPTKHQVDRNQLMRADSNKFSSLQGMETKTLLAFFLPPLVKISSDSQTSTTAADRNL